MQLTPRHFHPASATEGRLHHLVLARHGLARKDTCENGWGRIAPVVGTAHAPKEEIYSRKPQRDSAHEKLDPSESLDPITDTEIDILLASESFNSGEYNISHILIALG